MFKHRYMGPIFTQRSLFAYGAMAIAAVIVVALGSIIWTAAGDDDGVWSHIVETRLPAYTSGTVQLALIACVVSACCGIATAWLLTTVRVPGSRWLTYASFMPLAVPPYLSAFAYTDLLQASGPIQSQMREVFGWRVGEYWFPDPRSPWLAGLVLGLALTPYVFLVARQAFTAQASYALTVARTLGCPPVISFWRIALPMAAPACIGGCLLVLMEVVADFGVADYCSVDTLTTGVYRSWLGLDSPPTAARLSLVLLAGVVTVALFTRLLVRSMAKPYTAAAEPVTRVRLRRIGTAGALSMCLLPVLLGFVVPVTTFVLLALNTSERADPAAALAQLLNTACLAALTAALCAVLAVILCYAKRFHTSHVVHVGVATSGVGYAVPGPVIAIASLAPMTFFDQSIASAVSPSLLLTGSLAGLVLACSLRFVAVCISTFTASLEAVRVSLDEAAVTLGCTTLGIIRRVHLPVILPGLLAGAVLVFTDVAKELPLTLMLRPANFDTLAVKTYQLASDERLEEAALSALLLIAIGLVPALLLAAWSTHQKHKSGAQP